MQKQGIKSQQRGQISTEINQTYNLEFPLRKGQYLRLIDKHQSELNSSDSFSSMPARSLQRLDKIASKEKLQKSYQQMLVDKIKLLEKQLACEKQKNSKLQLVLQEKDKKEKELAEVYRTIAIQVNKQAHGSSPDPKLQPSEPTNTQLIQINDALKEQNTRLKALLQDNKNKLPQVPSLRNQYSTHDIEGNVFKTFQQEKAASKEGEQVNVAKADSEQKQKQKKEQKDDSFKTAKKLNRQSSFYSIDSKKNKNICDKSMYSVHNSNDDSFISIAPLDQFDQVSSVYINHNHKSLHNDSQIKQFFQNEPSKPQDNERIIQSQLLQSSKIQEQDPNRSSLSNVPQNQKISLKCIFHLKNLLLSLQHHLRLDSLFTPALDMISSCLKSRKRINCNQTLPLLREADIEAVGRQLVQKLNKRQETSTKQLLKQNNNLELELGLTQRELAQLKTKQQSKQRDIFNLTQELSRLKKQTVQVDSSSLKSTSHHYPKQICRSTLHIKNPPSTQQELQCSLICSQDYQIYCQFVSNITTIINQILQQKIGANLPHLSFSPFSNLEPQFSTLLSQTIDFVSEKIKQQNNQSTTSLKEKQSKQQHLSSRRVLEQKISFLHKETSILDEIDPDLYYELFAQNQQLQNKIKIHKEQILSLKQKIGLQKLQIQEKDSLPKNKPSLQKLQMVSQYSSPQSSPEQKSTHSRKGSLKIGEKITPEDKEEWEQFRQASQIRAYDNRKADQEEEIKLLKQKVDSLENQLHVFNTKYGSRKRKIYYLNQ